MSRTPRDVVVEEVLFLSAAGVPAPEVLNRLGMTATAVSRALQRSERYDLARPFQTIARSGYPRRTRTCADCGTRICVESTRCRSCEVTHRWGETA